MSELNSTACDLVIDSNEDFVFYDSCRVTWPKHAVLWVPLILELWHYKNKELYYFFLWSLPWLYEAMLHRKISSIENEIQALKDTVQWLEDKLNEVSSQDKSNKIKRDLNLWKASTTTNQPDMMPVNQVINKLVGI